MNSRSSAVLEVRFVGDGDVLDHIVDRQEGVRSSRRSVQTMVALSYPTAGKLTGEEEDGQGFTEQHYVQALGTEAEENRWSGAAGANVFTFQKKKATGKMSQMASEWASTPGKKVTFSTEEPSSPPHTGQKFNNHKKTPQKGKKAKFVSTTPYRLRRRLSGPGLKCDSDSELSTSDSGEEQDINSDEQAKTPCKMAVKRKAPTEPSSVEEYFEAHSSSKVLTSDRTLQRLKTPKLDRETLFNLLGGKPSCYSDRISQLHKEQEKHFSKWMLQLQLGFSVLLYGLGSKKLLLESFRSSVLSDSVHLVVNGFFPGITLKSILNAITRDVLEHNGSFRTPLDQIHFITRAMTDEPDFPFYLIIHNIDGPMLRAESTQQALGQLASIPNVHLLASIDHINAPLVWDQLKMSLYNWLWYDGTSFVPYFEETSYENSLLVQQTGALALSALTHVLRSLTPNARGIFRLLAEFQLENKENPSYSGLSFQEFYQRCREAFLVNSDITLRTQLTEFRDHKLIRTKKGADGVEYLLIPVETSTLTDFLEKNE